MSLALLIPVSLAMGLVALGAFFWALSHDQFSDPEGDAQRVLTPGPPLPRPRPKRQPDRPAAPQPERRKDS